jgi:hypothetical protein
MMMRQNMIASIATWLVWFKSVEPKMGSVPIIYGPQGSEKSTAVKSYVQCSVNSAMLNVDDTDKMFGKFNGMLTKHLLMIINETPEAMSGLVTLAK